jgi:hypothetical protein
VERLPPTRVRPASRATTSRAGPAFLRSPAPRHSRASRLSPAPRRPTGLKLPGSGPPAPRRPAGLATAPVRAWVTPALPAQPDPVRASGRARPPGLPGPPPRDPARHSARQGQAPQPGRAWLPDLLWAPGRGWVPRRAWALPLEPPAPPSVATAALPAPAWVAQAWAVPAELRARATSPGQAGPGRAGPGRARSVTGWAPHRRCSRSPPRVGPRACRAAQAPRPSHRQPARTIAPIRCPGARVRCHAAQFRRRWGARASSPVLRRPRLVPGRRVSPGRPPASARPPDQGPPDQGPPVREPRVRVSPVASAPRRPGRRAHPAHALPGPASPTPSPARAPRHPLATPPPAGPARRCRRTPRRWSTGPRCRARPRRHRRRRAAVRPPRWHPAPGCPLRP